MSDMDSEADRTARSVAEKLRSLEGTAPAWGLEILEAGLGRARLAMRVRDDMLNGLGTAHGGMIFALADTAFAYACNSRNESAVAQQASISFLSAAKPGELMLAEARENGVSGRSGVYTVTVTGEDDRVIAVFQGLSRTVGGAIVDTGV